MDKNCNRRAFFKKATTMAAVLAVTPFFVNSMNLADSSVNKLPDDNRSGQLPGFRPEIQLYCLKDGSVELRTSPKSGSKISHLYKTGFEVDAIMLIACNKPIDENISELARRNSLSESTCKGNANKLMLELETKSLIYYSDSRATKETNALYA